MGSILLVIGTEDHGEGLRGALQADGHDVDVAVTRAQAMDRIGPSTDLVVLDPDLSDGSGLDVLRRVRAEGPGGVPVVVLTARGDEIDRVVAFELGADDYVVRPFSVREFALRVRAILRRRGPPRPPSEMLEVGRLRVSGDDRRVWVDGAPVLLSVAEARLLGALASAPGHVWTREALLGAAWPTGGALPRTVDVHVRRLREKLGAAAHAVETVRGVGYRLAGRIGPAK